MQFCHITANCWIRVLGKIHFSTAMSHAKCSWHPHLQPCDSSIPFHFLRPIKLGPFISPQNPPAPQLQLRNNQVIDQWWLLCSHWKCPLLMLLKYQRKLKPNLHGCFRKKWHPQIIHFNRVFHYKPSILGYPYFRKHPHWPSRPYHRSLWTWTFNGKFSLVSSCFFSCEAEGNWKIQCVVGLTNEGGWRWWLIQFVWWLVWGSVMAMI